jgi:glyoxylase-like metal-dependent hydrolase (beta-lactamase superfamily II)
MMPGVDCPPKRDSYEDPIPASHATKPAKLTAVVVFLKHLLVVGTLLISKTAISSETSGAQTGSDDPLVALATLREKKWIHGSADCSSNADPAIEVHRYDQSSYVLRQNKCLSFEAPFVYVLIGDERVLVLDTGATESPLDFPLYETVRSLVNEQSEQDRQAEKELLVVHSHSHSDHYSGDSQFEGKPNVTIVEPNFSAMTEFFAFSEWPNGEATLELGGRKITIIPTPGHQEEAISVYDAHTQWLLTGDSLYPGYIYVKDWDEYQKSIARLVSFYETHEISAVLGAHVEMTDKAGEFYPIGTIYQPNEAPLTLAPESLVSLSSALEKSGKAQEIVTTGFIVVPMNAFQRTISNIARWIIQ